VSTLDKHPQRIHFVCELQVKEDSVIPIRRKLLRKIDDEEVVAFRACYDG
jgi:hypothetical protein